MTANNCQQPQWSQSRKGVSECRSSQPKNVVRVGIFLLLTVCTSHAFTSMIPNTKLRLDSPTASAGGDCRRSDCRSTTTTTALACQLLGVNSGLPTALSLEFWPTFCQRGGRTDVHAHGWGLAYYEGKGLRQFHDLQAASTSPLAKFLNQLSIRTCNMLAHIRYATTGAIDLANLHPFAREMWAMNWCFCHNGHVPLFIDHPDTWLGEVKGERFFFPVGETDSEATFCAILNALKAQFPDTMPSLPVLYDSLEKLCQQIVQYSPNGTILNFFLSCGPHVLWVYSWPGQRPGSRVWNGLHYTVRSHSTHLTDAEFNVKVLPDDQDDELQQGAATTHQSTTATASTTNGVEHHDRHVCIVATKPLSNDDEWIELKRGELIVMNNGLPHVSPRDLFQVELRGHGLCNQGKVLRPPALQEDMRRYELHQEFYAASGI